MNLRILIGLALALGCATSAHAACGFKSKDYIFPAGDGLGAGDGLLRITEHTNHSNTDEKVELKVTFHYPDNGAYNNYYLLDAVTPNQYEALYDGNAVEMSGAFTSSQHSESTLLNSDTAIADNEVLFTTHNLNVNDGVCNELDCVVKYDLLYEIGAAPDCGISRTGKKAVYVRAHYRIKLELHYRKIEGTVDFSAWHNFAASTDIMLTQSDVDRSMAFEAENVIGVAEFRLASNLILGGDGEDGDESTNAGACLSSNAVAQNSSGIFDLAGVGDSAQSDFDNHLQRCHVRGYGYIEQTQATSGSADTSFEDSDVDAASVTDLYSDNQSQEETAGVTMLISQYSQMGGTPDCGQEHIQTDAPSSPALTSSGEAKACTTGTDFRLDVCFVEGFAGTQVTAGVRTDPVEGYDKDDFDTYTFNGATATDDQTNAYMATNGGLLADMAAADITNVNAFVACKFLLDPPASCEGNNDDCLFTPLYYVAAWFDESIPTKISKLIDHDDYTNSNNRTYAINDEHDGGDNDSGTGDQTTDGDTPGDSQVNDPYNSDEFTASRRLRGGPRLLLKAAADKVAEPQKAKRVHFMHIHMSHGTM